MTKVVLTTKEESNYDDMREARYHFPERYLSFMRAALGDWGVYYEPRRTGTKDTSSGGRLSYVAVVKIEKISSDPGRFGHYYAELSSYLPFTQPVPFKRDGKFFESRLKGQGQTGNSGWFRSAVRPIPDSEYDRIFMEGFAHILGNAARMRPGSDKPEDPLPPLTNLSEDGVNFVDDIRDSRDREIRAQLVSRPFRDRAFAAGVKSAYGDTCAMSGLKFINGNGRSEVQAAHIKPVEHDGPDSVRNGLALSGTMHWLFDRGLLSVDDDFTLLTAASQLPDTIDRLLAGRTQIWVPPQRNLQPHPKFLQFHRRHIFKG